MLTFFPTPYPNEWWYSVLCRYKVWSGWMDTSAALREIYGEQRMCHGALFPTIDCYVTFKQIPDNIFSLKKLLLEHTLMPYYLRFYTPEKKRKILNDLLSGEIVKTSRIQQETPDGKQGLKFCPLCYAEDVETYGEPYWHREHQIPLMSICPKHKERLCLIEIPLRRLTGQLLPLCKISCERDMAQSEPHSEWEHPLSDFLFSILTMPFSVSPPNGYSNLKNVLLARGFGFRYISKYESLDADKIRQHCYNFYGTSIGEQYFAKLLHEVIYRICNWKLGTPERYVLLSVFAGLSVKELFGAEIKISDPLLEKLMKYKDKGIAYKKEELANLIGLNPDQLDSLANKYNIVPFWTQLDEERPECITIFLTGEEKQKIRTAASVYGNGPVSTFARTILMREVKQILSEQDEEAQNDI